jgi:hypothetical protein
VPGTDIPVARFSVFDRYSWGWLALAALVLPSALYATTGLAANRATGGRWVLPHRTFWQNTAGLVGDGIAFCRPSISAPLRILRDGGPASESPAARGGSTQLLAGAEGASDSGEKAKTVMPDQQRGEPTALHAAAAAGDGPRLQRLLSSTAGAATIDRTDRRGYTAFHVACAGGHAACVQMLLAAGADTAIKNDIGLVGLDLAQQMMRSDVVLAIAATPRPRETGASGARSSLVAAARPSELRELKALLRAKGLSAKGSKAELRARLVAVVA